MPFVESDGIQVFWREVGKGPPVLLIMGLETDHRGWARVIPFIKVGFRCISFDNRDVGRSGLASAPYAVSDMARDAVRLLDELGLASVSIIGQSLGGAIAQQIAASRPERVEKLILVSSFAYLPERSRAALRAWKKLRRLLSLREYYEAIFPWMYSESELGNLEFMNRVLDSAAGNDLRQSYEGFCRQVEAAINFDSRSWLKKIRVPTLIFCGTEDLITPPAAANELATGIERAELKLFENAGHGLVMTNAIESVNREIIRFLQI